MAIQSLELGTAPDDGTGDSLRVGGDKINDNFVEIYTALGDGDALSSGISASASVISLVAPNLSGVVAGTQTSATITTLSATTGINSGSTITLDATTDIILDADGGDIFFKDAGTTFGSATNTSGNLIIKSGTTTAATFAGANVTLAGTLGVGAITTTGAFKGADGYTIGNASVAAVMTLASTGIVTFADDIIIKDGGTIGAASAVAAMTISSGGIVTFVDDILIKDAGTIGSASDPDAIAIGADGDVTLTQDLELQHDGAILSFGTNDEVTLTHVHDTGILLNSTNVIQFNDASQNIGAPSNAILDINATDEIELNATLVDINANVEISGTAEITGIATFTDDIVIGDGKTIGSASAATAITIASTGIVSFVDDILIKNGGTIGSAGDADSIAIASNGVVTFSQIPVMPANSIDSDEYIDGSIDPEHLADNAVTLAKMASGTDGNIISYDASGNPVAIATGSDGQVLTSAGAGAQPAFEDAGGGTGAAFFVTSNAAQTIQHATATKVAFQVEGVDGDSLFSSNRFTPDTAGNYLLTTTILFGTIPTDTKYGNVEIRKNNNNDFSTTIGHFSSGDRAGISCTVFLPANGTGDYFEVFVYHIKGSAGNLYNACAFGGFKI